ncbi:MAG TPA: PAN domain-containing protein [Polyangiaceae bacterium]
MGTLNEGEYLFQGQRLVAPNCYFRLEMQKDGNLVIYGGPGNPIWDTDTQGPGASGSHMTLQTDNNLVVYSHAESPLWDTNTNGFLGTARLKMQDDGNLVMYSDVLGAYWASHTERAPQAWPCNQVPRTEATRVHKNTDRPGGDLPGMPLRTTLVPHHNWCGNECAKNASCLAYTYVPPSSGQQAACYLKGSQPAAVTRSGMVSGLKLRL